MNVTEDIKIKINELYYQTKNKSKVARELGISASTVSRYIVPYWCPVEETKKYTHEMLPPQDKSPEQCLIPLDEWYKLAVLSSEEAEALKELWKELSI